MAATPASAQNILGHMNSQSNYSGPSGPDLGLTSCRARAYQCGVSTLSYYGARRSLAWFQRGAREGSVPSMRTIGLILLRGEGDVRADPAAAMGWFYEAALRGDGLSMRALADGFEQGIGVGRDPALARYWRDRAARTPMAQPARFLRPIH
jgi:TPR repeat protein